MTFKYPQMWNTYPFFKRYYHKQTSFSLPNYFVQITIPRGFTIGFLAFICLWEIYCLRYMWAPSFESSRALYIARTHRASYTYFVLRSIQNHYNEFFVRFTYQTGVGFQLLSSSSPLIIWTLWCSALALLHPITVYMTVSAVVLLLLGFFCFCFCFFGGWGAGCSGVHCHYKSCFFINITININ